MSFFLENFWAWIILAAFVFFIGYAIFVNDKKNLTLFVTIIATAVILVGGIALERYIETDREAIKRTLKEISAAIKADDLTKVKSYTAPDAEKLRGVATAGMAQAKLSVVHFGNVEIKINDSTVPTTAELRFIVSFRGQAKGNTFFGDSELFDRYRFTAIFEKHGDRWLATDDVLFDDRFPLKYSNTAPVF